MDNISGFGLIIDTYYNNFQDLFDCRFIRYGCSASVLMLFSGSSHISKANTAPNTLTKRLYKCVADFARCIRMADTPYIVGIDEAGRGPVLGPMVYGVCWVPEEHHQYLDKCGMQDSKVLDHEKRSALVKKLDTLAETHNVGYKVTHLEADYLSAKMLSMPRVANLNSISHETAAALINHVVSLGHHVTRAYVDTVGDPDKYAAFLRDRIPSHIQVTVEAKADGTYPVVAAASIAAKTSRDSAVEALVDPSFFGPGWGGAPAGSTGSGYPGDPKTKAWLRKHHHPVFGFPKCVRFSWKTAARLNEDEGGVLFDFGDEEEFQSPRMGLVGINRPMYFKRRHFKRVRKVRLG